MQIPYENLQKLNQPYQEGLKEAFSALLESGWFILGEQVGDFEKAFAQYHGVKYCIGVASGLDALTISLMAFGFPAQSEVIAPANTCVPTILAIVKAGLKPVLIDPNPSTFNIEAVQISEVISDRTVAVLPVHLYGKPCQILPILELCQKHKLKLIEDCAQACGAEYHGEKVGTFGHFGAFSFYPTKTLGALGDAGAILTNDSELSQKVRALRNYGLERKNQNKYLGLNSRLDELQASFLRIKLQDLDRLNEERQKRADIYFQTLASTSLQLPNQESESKSVFHIFPVRHPQRDSLKSFLAEKGIGTEIHYPTPPHRQEAFAQHFPDMRFPQSEQISQTALSLPISPAHSLETIGHVADMVRMWADLH